MRRINRITAIGLAAVMAASMLAGCGGSASGTATTAAAKAATTAAAKAATTGAAAATTAAKAAATTGAAAAGKGKVYYLNFKPEQADQWTALGKTYTAKTGVPVTVTTAASGTYEQTLKSEMAKSDAPTLFQVNGPVGLASWKDYCLDLSNSDVDKDLSSKDFELKDASGAVKGIAYVIETYGIIYNKALLKKYCAMSDAKVKSADEINSFAKLKEVADDIQAKKKDLGVQGAFTSAGFDASSDWRFKTHLANLPIYYEYKKDGITSSPAIKGTYLDNYKQIFDLYITDSTTDKTMLSGKTGEDANSEFATGEAVFYQNGTWAYNDIKGNDVADEDLGMLPIYIGAEGEEKQGLCTGSENYWCVNAKASADDQKATLDFLKWVVESDEGRKALSTDMGFVTPFKTFTEEYLPKNPLVVAANAYNKDKTPVSWNFTTMPSEEWKNKLGSALLEYAQGTGSWDAVKTAFVDNWATEYKAAQNK
jgi:raffinose/stachyose/melibiose transport system substrate-binding protein